MHEIGNSEECDGGQSRTQARPKRVNDGPWWTNHIYLCRRPHGASADESGKSAKRETGPKRRVPILQSSSFIVWFEGTLPDLSVGSADPSKTARLANRTRPTALGGNAMAEQLYEDRWGEVFDRPSRGPDRAALVRYHRRH